MTQTDVTWSKGQVLLGSISDRQYLCLVGPFSREDSIFLDHPKYLHQEFPRVHDQIKVVVRKYWVGSTFRFHPSPKCDSQMCDLLYHELTRCPFGPAGPFGPGKP